jgi:hypothetical protein
MGAGEPARTLSSQGGKGLSSGLISGSEASWTEREDAQEKLLREGIRIAPLLEAAARSENVELAYRARYLLARIDPQLTEFQIVKIDTREKAVVELSAAAGVAGQALTAQSAADPAAASYSIEFRAMDPIPDRIEIWIPQTSPSPNGMEVRRGALAGRHHPLEEERGVPYRRLGLEIERSAALTSRSRVRTGRRSLSDRPFGSTRTPSSPSSWRISGGKRLRPTRRGRARSISSASWERQSPREPSGTRTLERSPRSPGLTGLLAGDSSRPGSDCLAMCCGQAGRSGDRKALHFLIERLVEGDPSHLHVVMASIADRAVRPGASGCPCSSPRDRVLG